MISGPVAIHRTSKEDALGAWLRDRGSVLVGFSGGVDSALLSVIAREVLGPQHVLAVLGVSASLARDIHDRAALIAKQFGVPFREVATHELNDLDYIANRGDRCFYCKAELWRQLVPIAAELGFASVLDGTIADDLAEHRPGFHAGQRAGVASPLAECGFTKGDVRVAARARGIPIWNAPAAPCLSSRIRTHVEVTPERLAEIDRAESALRRLGIDGDLRVRHLGDAAQIELPPAALADWSSDTRRAMLAAAVQSAGFNRVLLDLRGYRRGALQETGGATVTDITTALAAGAGDTSS